MLGNSDEPFGAIEPRVRVERDHIFFRESIAAHDPKRAFVAAQNQQIQIEKRAALALPTAKSAVFKRFPRSDK